MTERVTGTFEVSVQPQESAPGQGVARFLLKKQFSGPLSGKAVGTMLSVGMPKPGTSAAYVALDQFTGNLAGKGGGFVLVHRGIMTRSGATDLDVRIATDSGTGELEGISGSLKIDVRDGQHQYELEYQLP